MKRLFVPSRAANVTVTGRLIGADAILRLLFVDLISWSRIAKIMILLERFGKLVDWFSFWHAIPEYRVSAFGRLDKFEKRALGYPRQDLEENPGMQAGYFTGTEEFGERRHHCRARRNYLGYPPSVPHRNHYLDCITTEAQLSRQQGGPRSARSTDSPRDPLSSNLRENWNSSIRLTRQPYFPLLDSRYT